MAFSRNGLMAAAALLALGACTTTAAPAPDAAASAGIYAGKSVLDVAVDKAGGEAALTKVKELYWTGHAKVTAGDKVTELEVATVVRPFENARFTSWPKADGPKKGRTLQVEQGKAWDVNRVTWTPLPEAQAVNENQQLGLYSFMLLAPLKAGDVKEQAAGADGSRTIQTTAHGQTLNLSFDANGKLVRASGNVRDPKGGADIAQVATFSGEVESNGVKWPKTISITQNGAPFYDLEIGHFEALAAKVVRPLEQSMQYDPKAVVPGEGGDAG